MAAQDDIEARINHLIAHLEKDFSSLGSELRVTIARALIHRGVHHATDQKGVEFCALATYLADMISHGHKIAHGENPKAPTHGDIVH